MIREFCSNNETKIPNYRAATVLNVQYFVDASKIHNREHGKGQTKRKDE